MNPTTWQEACEKHYLLADVGAPLLVGLTEEILTKIKQFDASIAQAFSVAVHELLDARIAVWERMRRGDRRTSQQQPSRLLDGTPLRLRVRPNDGILIELKTPNSLISENRLLIESVQPTSVIKGLEGRQVGAIVDDPGGYLDPKRKILRGYVEMKRRTVFILSRGRKCDLTYRDIFGDPEQRFLGNQPKIQPLALAA